jgi:AcrR family transcriptional regulator
MFKTSIGSLEVGMKKEEDRRVIKTRRVIEDALFTLMQEKPYHKITIQELIDLANVGRSTFYSHYETKEDLLLSSIEHLLELLNQYIMDYLESKEKQTRLLPVVELFDHIKENSKLMKGLMKAESSDLFFDKVQTHLNNSIEGYIKAGIPKNYEPSVPIIILANHISSTLINLLKWWVNNRMPYTSEQMERYFQELINPCIDAVLINPEKNLITI